MAPTPGWKGQIFLAAGPSLSIGTLAMTDAGDHKTFNPGNAAKQYFDKNVNFTVQSEQDEVQTITITGGPTGGTFTLTFGGNTTATLNWNATAAQMQTALQALASIGANNILVTGGPGPGTPFVAEFVAAKGYANQATITLSNNLLTGGVSPSVSIVETQAGHAFTTATPGTFVINYPIGQVVFNALLLGTPAVQITAGNYFNANFFGFCKEWDGDFMGTALDTTAMTSPPSQWKTYIPGVNGGNAKLLHWWIDNTIFANLIAGVTLILALYTGVNANQRWQGYVILKLEDIKALIGAVTTDDLDFDFNGQPFYIPS
jgi:hypothetical protein